MWRTSCRSVRKTLLGSGRSARRTNRSPGRGGWRPRQRRHVAPGRCPRCVPASSACSTSSKSHPIASPGVAAWRGVQAALALYFRARLEGLTNRLERSPAVGPPRRLRPNRPQNKKALQQEREPKLNALAYRVLRVREPDVGRDAVGVHERSGGGRTEVVGPGGERRLVTVGPA